MKGRKATPTALKKIRGTDQPCRINSQEPESETITMLPPAPVWFTKLAKKVYKIKGSELIKMKLLSRVDLDMFVSYCVEYAAYLETSEQLTKIPSMALLDAESELLYKRLSQRNGTAWERSKTIATQFGFTPSSRASLKIVPPKKEDEFDKLFNS